MTSAKREVWVSGGRLWEVVPPHLLVLELDQRVVVPDDLVAHVLRARERLGKAVPLRGHLVAV